MPGDHIAVMHESTVIAFAHILLCQTAVQSGHCDWDMG